MSETWDVAAAPQSHYDVLIAWLLVVPVIFNCLRFYYCLARAALRLLARAAVRLAAAPPQRTGMPAERHAPLALPDEIGSFGP